MSDSGKIPRLPKGPQDARPGARPPGTTRKLAAAPPPRKLPLPWIAAGGVAVVLIVVVLVVALSAGRRPAPKTVPPDQPPPSAKGKPAKAVPVEAPAAGEDAAGEKAVSDMIDWGDFKGAAAALPSLPAASRDRVFPKLAAAADKKYEGMLRDAKTLAGRGKLADAKAHLLQTSQWGLPALADRARKDAEELPVVSPPATEQAVAQAVPAPPSVPPEPAPEPPKKVTSLEPLPVPERTEAPPKPAAKSETKAAGPGTTLSSRPPRKGPYQPGGLPDEEKQKKQTELAAAAKKEQKGSKKAAAVRRAEWLARLEKEKGVYDVATLVDKGDVDKRVDIVIVSAGFPKAEAKKVNAMADQLRAALLKVDPFQNYPEYINFHRINVDDPSPQASRIRLTIESNILTCDTGKAIEYARIAPSFDLVVVLCNVKNVRSTGGPPVITIDSDLNIGRTFLHEMGHAFASLNDEYVDATLSNRTFREDPEDDWVTNVTAVSNPKISRWHYWLMDLWPTAHDMNKLPAGHKVGCYEGAAYQAKGVFRPEEKCLMQMGDKYCVVCFEQVEKKFYRLIQPIDDARPRKPLVGAWLDDTVVLEADAIRTAATGTERIGKFEGLWYVDSKPRSANSKDLTTILSLKASELGTGTHEAGLRVDFSNRRIRRDDGWLSSSAGWKIDVTKYKKPKWDGPDKIQAKVGQPLAFDLKIEIPDAAMFTLELKDLPDGAVYENSKFTWTPAKAHQGAWRPRFILTDGLRSVERAVEIAVLDTSEKNFEPIFSPMDPVVVSEGESLDLTLEVQDVDGDNLVFTSPNLPEGAELDAYDGVVRWKPGARQSGRYPNIQIDVFDGRRHVKGAIEIQVEDAIRSEGPGKDPVHGLRNPWPQMRTKALGELDAYPRIYQYLEAARLLRDKGHEVREQALAKLKRIHEGADGPFVAMMIRDLAPHAWHFTDHKETLAWLDQLASKGEANSPDTKALKAALKGIEKYNKDRGF
jgi:hypothetical protein